MTVATSTTPFATPPLLLLLFAVPLSWHAAMAIHQDSGVDATECQWANTVHFGSTCTGTYLGDGLVVSAAHCSSPGSVKFGEYGKGGDGGLGWFNVKVGVANPRGEISDLGLPVA